MKENTIIAREGDRRVLAVDGFAVLQFKRSSGVAWRNGKMHIAITASEAIEILAQENGMEELYRRAGCFFIERRRLLNGGKVRQIILTDELCEKAKKIGYGNISKGVRDALIVYEKVR